MRKITTPLSILTILLVNPLIFLSNDSQTVQNPDSSLAPPIIITNPGPSYAADTREFQGIPSIEKAPNGRLWAAWYGGGPGEGEQNYVILVTSEDDGKSWSSEKLVIDPVGKVRAFDPALWIDPTGKMWLFWAQSFTLFDGRAGVWAVTTTRPGEENPPWSEPRRLCDGIMMNKPLALAPNEWLFPVAVWKRKSPFHPDIPHEKKRSTVYLTADQGKTFTLLGGSAIPERTFDEHMLAELASGDLWMMVRTRYGIGQSFSSDRGKTWTPGENTGLDAPGSRFHLRKLKSGNFLLIRNGTKNPDRNALTAYLSEDQGKSWPFRLLLDGRDYVSYPDAAVSEEGTVYAIYDYARYRDKEILLAVFTEQDIKAGRCLSPASRLAAVVSKSGKEQPKIVISPPGRIFENEMTVTLSYPAVKKIDIYYTLDGTEPTVQSPLLKYDQDRPCTVTINQTTTLKAKAIYKQWNTPTVSETYTKIK